MDSGTTYTSAIVIPFKDAAAKQKWLDDYAEANNWANQTPQQTKQAFALDGLKLWMKQQAKAGRDSAQAKATVLADGRSYKDFLEGYPTVSEEQMLAVLKEAEKRLLDEYEILEKVRDVEEILLCQRSGLAHVLGLILSALPNDKGEHLTVETAHRFVKESLENGRLLEVNENTKF